MPSPRSHSTIIARSAREAFQQLGLIQKGRSRIWFADHDWWLIHVEFQPSSWDRGTYLNVGAMWLWYPKPHFSFDVDYRARGFVKYDSDAQFQLAIQPLLKEAIQRIRKLRKDFSSVSGVASYYRRKRKGNYWDLFNGGLASGLVGDASNASKLLSQFVSIQDDRDWMKAAQAVAGRFLPISHSRESFREEASAQVQEARHLLNLTDLPNIKW